MLAPRAGGGDRNRRGEPPGGPREEPGRAGIPRPPGPWGPAPGLPSRGPGSGQHRPHELNEGSRREKADDARVAHLVPADRGSLSYFLSRCRAEGRSKALLARFVGASDGLSDERAYTARTLPRGVARGIGDALHGDLGGLRRAGAIVLGLATTTLGYATGRLAREGRG